MLLDGKEYKMGKFTRKLNKEYNEISAKVEAVDKKGEGYSDELLDEMVDMIVKLFGNQFTADEVNAERVSFATFISAAVSDSDYKALRFAENYYQLGSTSSKVIYRTSAGPAGYNRWHWTITEEVSTPED